MDLNTQALYFHDRRQDLLQTLTQIYEMLEQGYAQGEKKSAQFRRSLEDALLNLEVRYLEYRQILNLLPKNLQRHHSIRQCTREIKKLDKTIHRLLPSIGDYALSPSGQRLLRYSDKLKGHVNQLVDYLSDREILFLIERFFNGESLLGYRSVLQWGRKIFHLGVGSLALWIYAGSGLDFVPCMIFFSSVFWTCFALEIVRHRNARFNEWVCTRFKYIIREQELHTVTSAVYYMASVYIVLWVFPRPIATLAFAFIVFGDPIASIVGTLWGRTRVGAHATLEGMAGCFTVCALLTWWLAPPLAAGFPGALLVFSLLGGIIGSVAEISFPRWDDNLVMPLVSAPLLWVLTQLFS